MRQKPKIAIVSIKNSYQHGGVLATLKIVYNFCQQYFDPTVFTLGFDKSISAHIRPPKFTSQNRAMTYCDMPCVEVGARWAFWEPGHYAFTKKQWEAALADYDYVFVVSATPIAAHPLVLLNKKFLLWASTSYRADRTERVKQMTGIRKFINQRAEKKMEAIEQSVLQKASAILPLSSYSQKEFQSILGAHQRSMETCGYPMQLPEMVTGKPFHKTIIAVGRYSDPRKNIAMLMRTFGTLSHMLPGVRMMIVGQVPSMDVVGPFVHESWYGNIIFTGPTNQQELHELYRNASLMLITSYQEGFGIAGLEAMAHGIPIVSTDCGGVSDYVLDGMTGYLVPIDDDRAMAFKACTLLTDYNRQRAFADAGRALVRNYFSHDYVHGQFKKGLAKVYPELQKVFERGKEDANHVSTQGGPELSV